MVCTSSDRSVECCVAQLLQPIYLQPSTHRASGILWQGDMVPLTSISDSHIKGTGETLPHQDSVVVL